MYISICNSISSKSSYMCFFLPSYKKVEWTDKKKMSVKQVVDQLKEEIEKGNKKDANWNITFINKNRFSIVKFLISLGADIRFFRNIMRTTIMIL